MKKKLLVLLFIIIAVSGTSYARRIGWNKTKKPPIELEEALKIAKTSIQMEEYIDYHCINASLSITFSDADWLLYFTSKSGAVWVNVASDRTVSTSGGGFEY